MKPEILNTFKEALNRELTYYQQLSPFLADLPSRFHTQTQAESALMDLMTVMDMEGTTHRFYREHIWQTVTAELKASHGEARLSASFFQRIGEHDLSLLLQQVQLWAHRIQQQLIKVVIYLKQYNRLNQNFLRLHDTLSNAAYTGRGVVRPKPSPRHMDQEV